MYLSNRVLRDWRGPAPHFDVIGALLIVTTPAIGKIRNSVIATELSTNGPTSVQNPKRNVQGEHGFARVMMREIHGNEHNDWHCFTYCTLLNDIYI